MTTQAQENLDQSATFRPTFAPSPEQYASELAKKDLDILNLSRALEEERRENSRLRAQLADTRHGL